MRRNYANKRRKTMRIKSRKLSSAVGGVIVACGIALPLYVQAQNVAPSYVADPEVYKILGENEHFRVIMATWKPGTRDAWHSHSGALVGYRLSECKQRVYTPDGKFQERTQPRGYVNFTPVVSSHSVENIGKTECQVLIVEKK
jgi:beta-alanine degradation protein BauB